jgi:hypothetical protein
MLSQVRSSTSGLSPAIAELYGITGDFNLTQSGMFKIHDVVISQYLGIILEFLEVLNRRSIEIMFF